jgi:hypothetical protein
MATTETSKNTGSKSNGRSRSTTNKAADVKRSATQRGKRASDGRSRNGGNGRRGYQLPNMQDMPAWATTLASVVGVGVAVGVGLFATRRQWLPQAEEWGDQLQERFGRGQNDDDEFYGEDDSDDWEGGNATNANFPGTGATAAGAV